MYIYLYYFLFQSKNLSILFYRKTYLPHEIEYLEIGVHDNLTWGDDSDGANMFEMNECIECKIK